MGVFNKLMRSFRSQQEETIRQDGREETQSEEEQQEKLAKVEKEVKERLKSIVYDEQLIEELAPAFTSMYESEYFNQVFELLEVKERQIQAISKGEWFEQESEQGESVIEGVETETQPSNNQGNLVESYLNKKYGE